MFLLSQLNPSWLYYELQMHDTEPQNLVFVVMGLEVVLVWFLLIIPKFFNFEWEMFTFYVGRKQFVLNFILFLMGAHIENILLQLQMSPNSFDLSKI